MDYQLALIIISLIGFFVVIALDLFFVYLPVYRIEKKVDEASAKFDATNAKIDATNAKIDLHINEARAFALKAEIIFEEYKADICKFLDDLGLPKPDFCNGSS